MIIGSTLHNITIYYYLLPTITMLYHKITLVFLRSSVLPIMMAYAFHPDFQHGRSAYFDVSICCTTQLAYISSSTSCAGVTAAAGEMAKDEKHLAAVVKVGTDFIPLVMETFGVWTPCHLLCDL